jgi:hypothetical protein
MTTSDQARAALAQAQAQQLLEAVETTAVTPPVANEDAAREALATHADGLQRIVTAALTADLD